MRAVVQRCHRASVAVAGTEVAAIGYGMAVFAGVGTGDGDPDVDYLAAKLGALRIFPGPDGRLSLGPVAAGAALLLIPQFTLYGDVRRGLRPDFTAAAAPEQARRLLAALADRLCGAGLEVAEGRFGAEMTVHVAGDGPVTVLLDSRRLF